MIICENTGHNKMDLHVDNPLFKSGCNKERTPEPEQTQDDQDLYEYIPYEALSKFHR